MLVADAASVGAEGRAAAAGGKSVTVCPVWARRGLGALHVGAGMMSTTVQLRDAIGNMESISTIDAQI